MTQFKQRTRKRRRSFQSMKNARVFFRCYCRKQYISYPALYLHAKLKHDIKIARKNQVINSQKMTKYNQYQVNGSKIYQLQLISQNGQLQSRQPQQIQQSQKIHTINNYIKIQPNLEDQPNITIDEVIEEYLKILKFKYRKFLYKDISFLFYLLKKCLNSYFNQFDSRKISNSQNYTHVQEPSRIPYSFNFFLTVYIPWICDLNPDYFSNTHIIFKNELKSIIFEFGKWLYEKKYTNFKTQYAMTQDL